MKHKQGLVSEYLCDAMAYYLVLGEQTDDQNTGTLHEEAAGACLAAHDCLAHQLAKGNSANVSIERVVIHESTGHYATVAREIDAQKKDLGAK